MPKELADMKPFKLLMTFTVLSLLAALFAVPAQAAVNPLDTSAGSSPIVIDGYFNDWADKPFTWEYNWNNPPISGEGGYTTNSRHQISLYRDDSNVYLHIIMAKNYYNSLVGDDYEFTCDGVRTIFRITTPDGASISSGSFGAGIHPVQVRNGDGSISGQVAQGSAGMLLRHDGGINDELEISIPIADFHAQNSAIDAADIKEISFFTPNLMMYGDKITCAGTSTAPYIGIALCVASVGVGTGVIRKKRKKKLC
jgi:hypothetical protein